MTSLPTDQWNDKAKEDWKIKATCFGLTRAKKKKAHKAGKCEDCGCCAMCAQPPWCNATSDHHNTTYMDHNTKTTKKRPAEADTNPAVVDGANSGRVASRSNSVPRHRAASKDATKRMKQASKDEANLDSMVENICSKERTNLD